MPTRRQFVLAGVAGAAVLVAARFLDRPRAASAPGHRFLDEGTAPMIAALVPVVLAGSLPADPTLRASHVRDTVAAFDRAVSGLAPAVQEEIAELLSLLAFAPTRIAVAGLWSPVAQSSPEELMAFLDRWRASRFELPRASYQALTQLIQASWYGNAAAWGAIGYPGPPALTGGR